jgi:NAD(P)-dependent dehydrogenase (short-subunit alcohol dehydrogenase family)
MDNEGAAGRIELAVVDLAALESVERFCGAFCGRTPAPKVKGLVLNAGVISANAVEVNHLGHAALTIGLLGPLVDGRGTVVSVSSVAGQWVPPGLQNRLCQSLRTAGMRDPQDEALGEALIDPTPTFDGFPTAWSTAKPNPQAHGGDWSHYSDSKAANSIFMRALARRYDALGVRAVSYHPGVMATELWRAHQEDTTRFTLIRAACCLCIKHPCVSGAGLAALVAPRGCFPHHSCFFVGTGGGYYQQCCYLCTVPVRSIQSGVAVETALWNDTLLAMAAEVPDLVKLAAPMLQRARSPPGPIVHASCPGTELLALAPYPCFCFACLC